MMRKRICTIAITVLILLTATIEYVSAREEALPISQENSEDDGNTVTFRVRIQNISADADPSTLFSPGVWVLHNEAGPLFTSGEVIRRKGLEALAEDGDPTSLAASLRAQGLKAGIFDTPVCTDTPGLLPSGKAVEFGGSYEFEVTATPETPYLSFATMLVQSNDLFIAPSENGIPLFDENGKAVGVKDVTAELYLWDAGTEENEEPGAGPNQAPRQPGPNTGAADEVTTVRVVDDGFSHPNVTDILKAYIVQVPMIKRDRGRQTVPPPDYSINEIFRVGDVQWRVLSAENLGYEITNDKGDRQTTDERFVQVQFELLNLGSDPLEFDGGPLRNRKGVLLRDGQARKYPYYLVPRTGRPDGPPHDFVPESENCYGKWSWGFWKPYILKPNSPTTCSVIYEVNVDAMDLTLVASDLGDGDVSVTKTVDLNLPPVSRHSVGEYVRVGDVRWLIHSAEDLGNVLETTVDRVKTRERFISVRFEVRNEGSDSFDFDIVDHVRLRDKQGREYEHYLVPRIGLPDRYPSEHIPDDEECTGLEMKPNKSATCTGIYEVPTDATGLILIANDLGENENGAEIVDLGLSDYEPVKPSLFAEDVMLGDLCWNVYSIKDLGRELSSEEGHTATAKGRFMQIQFRLLNLGSETLMFEGTLLFDDQKRVYEHFHIERIALPDRHPSEHIPDDEECFHFQLKPNAPKNCTVLYDVAEDAEKFGLFAADSEGYDPTVIFLPVAKRPPCLAARSPVAAGGPYAVCKEVAPGVYRGVASTDNPCTWERLDDLNGGYDSVIAARRHESPFYVEILDTDAAFTTECELVPIKHIESRDQFPTELPLGMYKVGLDIGPGVYEGKPEEGLFCFWQRLKNFRGEDDSTIEWDIPGEAYVVEVEPSDYGVEFACHVELVRIPQDWQEIEDDRLGYSLAVPAGWHIINLQRVEQHPLWGMFKRLFPDAAVEIKEFVDSPAGENVGYLALELDMFPKPSIKSIALVAAVPLADDMPPEIVIQLLHSAVQSISLFPVEVQSLESGMTNNYPSIQGVVSADLSAFGLFDAHAIITALRANDTAYILVAATPVNDAEAKQKQLKQIVDTFRPR